MKAIVSKSMVFTVLVGALVITGGCRSGNPNAGILGSNDNLYGDPLMSDVPLNADNLGLPTDGDRSLFAAVFFAYDSSQVNPEEAGKCEQVAAHLKKGKARGVILEGHADERGSREYNQSLSERRALAVRDYLISLGAEPASIQTKGYGEEKPEHLGHDEAAWRQNRRVVFAIY